jgi:di-N-acetylchitobiase
MAGAWLLLFGSAAAGLLGKRAMAEKNLAEKNLFVFHTVRLSLALRCNTGQPSFPSCSEIRPARLTSSVVLSAHSRQGSYHGNTSDWPLWPWERIHTVSTYSDDLSDALLSQATATATRVALTMGGPDDSGAPNETVRSAWIQNTVQAVRSSRATGVNMDVEAVMKKGSRDSAALSALLAELRAALPKNVELSFDAAARPCYERRCYNYTAIAAAVDRIFVMDYDLNDYDDPPPDNDHSRANAPLSTVEKDLKQLLGTPGVTAEKLVVGLPWYGYMYYTVDGHAVDNDQLGYGEIEPMLTNSSWLQRWDESSQTPYLVEQTTAHSSASTEGAVGKKIIGREIWYDDPRSLKLKVAMAKRLGIRNFGCWTADALNYKNSASAKAMWDSLL